MNRKEKELERIEKGQLYQFTLCEDESKRIQTEIDKLMLLKRENDMRKNVLNGEIGNTRNELYGVRKQISEADDWIPVNKLKIAIDEEIAGEWQAFDDAYETWSSSDLIDWICIRVDHGSLSKYRFSFSLS